jgi:hypothetical protein
MAPVMQQHQESKAGMVCERERERERERGRERNGEREGGRSEMGVRVSVRESTRKEIPFSHAHLNGETNEVWGNRATG